MPSGIEKPNRRGPIVFTDADAAKLDAAGIFPVTPEKIVPVNQRLDCGTEATAQPTATEKANEAGIIPASCEIVTNLPKPPEAMGDEELADYVIGTYQSIFQKIKAAIPYIEALRARFAKAPRGKANIAGCNTWNEFCKGKLERTASAIRKAISAAHKEPPKPQILLAALKRLEHVVDKNSPIDIYTFIKFEVLNGEVFVTGNGLGAQLRLHLEGAIVHDPVITLWPEPPEELARRVQSDLPEGVRHEHTSDQAEAAAAIQNFFKQYEETIKTGLPPFAFLVTFGAFLRICERLDGDPTLTFHGPRHGSVTTVQGDGRLHFQYIPSKKLVLSLFPYTGDFLPDLKPGDEVTVQSRFGTSWSMQTVQEINGARIVTADSVFNREGKNMDWEILRITNDEDRQLAAARQAEAQAKREEMTRDATEKEKARREEWEAEQAARKAFIEKVDALVAGTKFRASQHDPKNQTAFIGAHVTLKELEKIADALEESPVDVAGNIPATLDPAPDPEA